MKHELLKDKKLMEAHKQFMRLCEYTYVPQALEEDGEDDMQNDNMGDNMNQEDPNMMPQDNAMGNDMNQPPMDNNNPMPQDNQMGDMGQDNATEMPQDNAMTDSNDMMPDMPMGEDPMEAEDETVIDVEDITNAQEKMNDKVNVVGQDLGQVDKKIETLLQSLAKMETMINNNNQEIANFKAEFEKRNPTQTEKLNLRSLDSYPFNVNPKDYWAEKGADPNSNYSGFTNNGEPTTQEYVITNNDVDDFSERDMEHSFDVDDELKQDINKIFGL